MKKSRSYRFELQQFFCFCVRFFSEPGIRIEQAEDHSENEIADYTLLQHPVEWKITFNPIDQKADDKKYQEEQNRSL